MSLTEQEWKIYRILPDKVGIGTDTETLDRPSLATIIDRPRAYRDFQ